MVDGLRQRVADPVTQDQGASSLCGPAVFLFCLLNDKPELYVQYVIDLYTSGRASIGPLTVTPGADCRKYSPKAEEVAPVDWIALASLRDSENTILNYQSADDEAAGITMPHSLASWFRAAGYQQVQNVTNVVLAKGRSDIDAVHHLRLQGRKVCLFVNSKVVADTPDTSRSLIPNHWVVLLSSAGVTANKLNITVYSWAKRRRIPATGDLDVDDFCHNFYGYVSGVFPPPSP